jgi:RecA DNA recombination protein
MAMILALLLLHQGDSCLFAGTTAVLAVVPEAGSVVALSTSPLRPMGSGHHVLHQSRAWRRSLRERWQDRSPLREASSSLVALVLRTSADPPDGPTHAKADPTRQAESPGCSAEGLRRLAANIDRTRTVMLFGNRLRTGGAPEDTPSDRASRFYASVCLELRTEEALRENGLIIGRRVRAVTAKNKVAPPLRATDLTLLYGRGFVDRLGWSESFRQRHHPGGRRRILNLLGLAWAVTRLGLAPRARRPWSAACVPRRVGSMDTLYEFEFGVEMGLYPVTAAGVRPDS